MIKHKNLEHRHEVLGRDNKDLRNQYKDLSDKLALITKARRVEDTSGRDNMCSDGMAIDIDKSDKVVNAESEMRILSETVTFLV